MKHSILYLFNIVFYLFTSFPVFAQNRQDAYSLDDYCSVSCKDIASIINRLLQSGDVYIPSGKWKINSKIKLPNGRSIIGSGIKTIIYSEEPIRMVEVAGDENEIKNICFQGANNTDKASYIVYKCRGTKRLLVENCSFEGATGGIFIEPLCDSIDVYGCNFSKMYPCKQRISSGYGIVFHHDDKKPERGTFCANIERCIFDETVFRHSIYLQSSENVAVRNNVFYGLNEKKTTECEYQIEIRGCRNLIFEGNISRGGYGFINGIESKYHGRGSNFVIRKNYFIDNIDSDGKKGILNIKFHNVLIQNNAFLNYNTLCVYIASVDGTIIDNNQFESRDAEVYPVIQLKGKDIESLTITNNTFSRRTDTQIAAVLIQSSKVNTIIVCGNTILGGSTGIEIKKTIIDSLTINDNYHNGLLCDYSGNTILKSITYNNNHAIRHPEIKVKDDIIYEKTNNSN